MAELEEEYEDDEEEYEEDDFEKPKTKDHVTNATIETRYEEKTWDGKPTELGWSGFVNGSTTGVSSGSGWGSSIGPCKTREELIQAGVKRIEEHNIWCDSWAEYKECEVCKGKEFQPGEECPECLAGRFELDYEDGKAFGRREVEISHRKNEKYTSVITVDGVLMKDPKTQSLNKWFG